MKEILFILIVLLAQQGISQEIIRNEEDASAVNETGSKKDYLEDLNQLVDSIQTHHPQPYEFISKRDFDLLVDKRKNEITDSTTIRQFSWICRSISAMVGCLHTSTSAGNILKLSPGIFFPLSVRYVDSKLYITESYATNNQLKKGVEILKINGIDVLDLRKDIAAHISTDGYNQSHTSARINASFGYFCAYKFDFTSTYKLEVNVNGDQQEVLLNQGEIHNSNNASSSQTENLNFTIKPSDNMATITIKSFVYYDEQLPVFKSFIDSCFNQIELHNIENVVIDLRNNGGGDPYCAVHLLQYISNCPFRYYKKDMSSSYEDLTKKIKPFKNNYSGKLYVLINSLCCSTTGHLCSILKHNVGVLIGSETGATYSCNAFTVNFNLKNTQIYASVATTTYQTDVSGFEKNRGILPDYQITRKLEDILSEKDLEMEKVMELMLEN